MDQPEGSHGENCFHFLFSLLNHNINTILKQLQHIRHTCWVCRSARVTLSSLIHAVTTTSPVSFWSGVLRKDRKRMISRFKRNIYKGTKKEKLTLLLIFTILDKTQSCLPNVAILTHFLNKNYNIFQTKYFNIFGICT